MITYPCSCGATLFFESTRCVSCGMDCGWCDACRRITTVQWEGTKGVCSHRACGAALFPCLNRKNWDACNALVTVEGNLCRSCVTTTGLPDLSIPKLADRWRRLEAAKRRLIYDLDRLGIDWETNNPSLQFQFLSDQPDRPVTTGHQNGVITINLREADPIAREKARQRFDESQRTLIGHLRHEVAHSLWQTHVAGRREEACLTHFGDHNDPPYDEAMPAYYENGPKPGWEDAYISAYATSHPWEDFAETTAFYLDMRSVVETFRHHFGPAAESAAPPFQERESCDGILATYREAGFGLNEVSRSLGLIDALPEVVSAAVVEKLRFVDSLFVPAASQTR